MEGRKATAALVATASSLFHAEPVEGLHQPVPGDTFLFFMCGSGVWECFALRHPVVCWAVQVLLAAGNPAAP